VAGCGACMHALMADSDLPATNQAWLKPAFAPAANQLP
jgi:hypothetical protein